MHYTQIYRYALNFIRTCIILYFATLSATCDVLFFILLSKNPIFTVPKWVYIRYGYIRFQLDRQDLNQSFEISQIT